MKRVPIITNFKWPIYQTFKACVHYFLSNFHCSLYDSPSKSMKNIFYFINCLNKNLITHFVWYVKKEIRCDIETLSINRELNRKCAPKASPRPFLILLNNPQQPLQARNSFERRLSKSLKKVQFIFSFEPSLF